MIWARPCARKSIAQYQKFIVHTSSFIVRRRRRVGLSALMCLFGSYFAKCCLSAKASHRITKLRKSPLDTTYRFYPLRMDGSNI